MELLEAIRPLLNKREQQEAGHLLTDYRNLNISEFFEKYESMLSEYWDDGQFFEDSQVGDLSNELLMMYLVDVEVVLPVDWSGEEDPGQIKKHLRSRLKHCGQPDVKLSAREANHKLEHGEVRRGEWVPLLMHCFDRQVAQVGLRVVSFDLGADEYNIALVPDTWLTQMQGVQFKGYFRITSARP
jgi:hypothetical protein